MAVRRKPSKQRSFELGGPVDAGGLSTQEGQVDEWGRPVLSEAKLKKLQGKMQAAMLGTDPRKFLQR